MFTLSYWTASNEKLEAKKLLGKYFSKKSVTEENEKWKSSFDTHLIHKLDKEELECISQAYKEYNDKFSNNDEFKLAVSEFLLDDYLQKIKSNISSNPPRDVILVKEIIGKLNNSSWFRRNLSPEEKFICAKELLEFLQDGKEARSLKPNNVEEKYLTLRAKFAKEINAYNTKIDSESIINLGNKNTKNKSKNSFFYDQTTNKLFYYNSKDQEQEINITNVNKVELVNIIKKKDLVALKNLLGNDFPKDIDNADLESATIALNASPTVNYYKAKIGIITGFVAAGAHKPPGQKAREERRRQEYINGLTKCANTVQVAREILNEPNNLNNLTSPIGLQIVEDAQGLPLDSRHSIVTNDTNDRFIIKHIGDKNIEIYFVSYLKSNDPNILPAPIINILTLNDGAKINLLNDLLCVFEQRPAKLPLLKRSSTYYKNNTNKSRYFIDSAPIELIDFIVDATGYVPPDFLQNENIEIAQIKQRSKECKNLINSALNNNNKRSLYLSIVDVIEKIATLPHTSFRTKESIVPRYKCLDLLKTLEEKIALELNPKGSKDENEEYFRSEYMLYEFSGDEPEETNHSGPRFYFNPKTRKIIYFDNQRCKHESQIKLIINTGLFIDYFVDKFVENGPNKLIHLLQRKNKESDGGYKLDSEEVFKYISSQVMHPDEFEMYTINEELEKIIADEIVSTRESLKNLCLTALYTGFLIFMVVMPGFNILLITITLIGLHYFPILFDSIALGAFEYALQSLAMALLGLGVTAIMFFVPGLNLFSFVPAAGAMIYFYIGLSALYAAYNLTLTLRASSKIPVAVEANKELLNLKEKLKELVNERSTLKEAPQIISSPSAGPTQIL